jgi:Arc/MetJ-type ribon-helix-helix transcriptional regulator
MYYMTPMPTDTSRSRTIAVRLPDALAAEIETEARKRGVSRSDVVRERLERAREDTELPPHLEDIADLIGSIDDNLPAELSARRKHYLRVYGFGRNLSR